MASNTRNVKTPSPQAKTSTPSSKTSKSTPSPESNKSASSPEINKKPSYQRIVWPPVKCTPLCFEDGPTGCLNAGKHHELIMALAKCSNTSETDKTNFKKSLDKFTKTKWLRSDCVPDKNEKLRFPLIHWACMLGKYKPLEYLVSEKGFELTVKVGKNQQGPLHSMVQHLSSGLNPKSSKEHVCTVFGNIIDIFLKNVPEAFCEKHASSGDTILHVLAKRCSADACSRMYLKTVLVKIKESDKISPEKLEEILSAVNKRGDTFLHVIVSDEESMDTVDYFFKNFGLTSEKISKAKNNFGKTPCQIAVEKRSSKCGQKSAVKSSPAAEPSSEENNTLKNKEAPSSRTRRNLTVQTPAQEKRTASAAGDQQCTENISSDQLPAEVLNLCSCDPPTDKKEQPSDSTSPTKRTIEPFPQRFLGREEGNGAGAVNNASKVLEIVDVETAGLPEHTQEVTSDSPDRNVFLSLSNIVNSLTKGESLTNNRKTPATRASRASNKKRGRGNPWSDSESDTEDDKDFSLDDDSDDDMESEVKEKEEEEGIASDTKQEVVVNNAPKEVNEETNDDIELDTAPKHTPFCRQNCISQHHKLLLSLMKCSNYAYGIAYNDMFMKQVNDYINQLGKFSDVRANADLPDPVASFKYPLVHWVCVLGKFKVLEKLAEMKEFNLGVQSERTGETGLHRMLLSLDQAMVLRKNSVKTILEVFSKTLKTLTDNLPSVITVCTKEGDTAFHCLAKVILDCTSKLEKVNTYEGYFEHLTKDLTRLKTSGKLTPEIVKELLLKTNNSKETFLHILACRQGVGHRVIKSVLKNIDPEIMNVLKEMKNADGKTPSDLAVDLCSHEMAAILRPSDQEPATTDGENPAEELPQTPDHNAPQKSPGMQSPPASSPSVSTTHHNAARKTTVLANSSKSTSTPSTSTNHNNRATISPTTNQCKRNSEKSSIMSEVINMPQSDKLQNTSHAKLQELRLQTERKLSENEEALFRLRQQETELQNKAQKLAQEREETWKEILAVTREEGAIESKIEANKRDRERLTAELAKWETSLEAIRNTRVIKGSNVQHIPEGGVDQEKRKNTATKQQQQQQCSGKETACKCNNDNCDKCFPSPLQCIIDTQINTGEKSYQCKYCEKDFIRLSNLRVHKRIHTGKKPYQCQYCDKKFSDPSAFRKHEQTHTQEKHYQCKYCSKCFIQRTNVNTHERMHTGETPYRCKDCDKQFSNLSSYKIHERTHTGEKPYKCKHCHKGFGDLSNCKRHEKKNCKQVEHNQLSDLSRGIQ